MSSVGGDGKHRVEINRSVVAFMCKENTKNKNVFQVVVGRSTCDFSFLLELLWNAVSMKTGIHWVAVLV